MDAPGVSEPCHRNPATLPCALGLMCVDDGTCTELPHAGQPCLAAFDDLFCDDESRCIDGQCKTIVALDGACGASDQECEAHTVCENGLCVPDDELTLFDDACQ